MATRSRSRGMKNDSPSLAKWARDVKAMTLHPKLPASPLGVVAGCPPGSMLKPFVPGRGEPRAARLELAWEGRERLHHVEGALEDLGLGDASDYPPFFYDE